MKYEITLRVDEYELMEIKEKYKLINTFIISEQENYKERLIKYVCLIYNKTLEDLIKSNRREEYMRPRSLIMYMLRTNTKMKLEDIGAIFNRDHSTVSHAKNRISLDLEPYPFGDPELKRNHKKLIKLLS